MPLPQFSDLTPESAAEFLAVQSLLGQQRREKQAAEYPAFSQLAGQLQGGLSHAWQNLAKPSNMGWEAMRNGLIGAGVGGIGGVAMDALDGDPTTNGGRGLQGALAGGLLGGGGTLGLRSLEQYATQTPSEKALADAAKRKSKLTSRLYGGQGGDVPPAERAPARLELARRQYEQSDPASLRTIAAPPLDNPLDAVVSGAGMAGGAAAGYAVPGAFADRATGVESFRVL
jgi:hypothetical protein